jgi:hypothetical protein
MTLKELATQLNRPMGEIVKSLAKHGFKGIYRNTHTVPAEAVEIVTNDIAGNLTALPSANTDDQPIEQENITPNQDAIAAPAGETAQETESLLQQTSQAMVATAEQVAVNRNQQLISNAEVLGITDAIGSNLAYKRAYADTMQTLAVLDSKAQSELLATLTNKLNNPDFFGNKTTQETYYNTSQDIAKDTAKDLRAMVNNLSY